MRILLASSALLATAAILPAQYSGTLQIVPAGGSGVFTTFTQAVNALFVSGVNGPVTVLVHPGTYNESVLVPPIPGASPTNTVTFKALLGRGTVQITGNGGDTFALVGVSFRRNSSVGFEDLDFVSGPGFAISGTTNVENVSVTGCSFGPEHRNNASGEFRHALIVSENSGTEAGWKLRNNRFTLPSYTNRTNYGIYLSNGGGWDISGNSFDLNGVTHALYLINQNRRLDRIWNNTFTGNLRQSTSTSASNQSVIKVDVSNYDNDIAFNSFLVNVPGAAGCCIAASGISGTNPALNRIRGNIFSMTGPGTCIVMSAATNPLVSDNNIFWAPTGEVARQGASTPGFATLAAWQTAANVDLASQQVDPFYTNSTTAPFDLRPILISTAKDQGGAPLAFVVDDLAGRLRDPLPDCGAYEMSGFAYYGQGCAGTGSLVPAIGSSGLVAVGSTNFSVDLSNSPANTLAFLVGGNSRTTSGATTLPFDLGGGCSVLAAPVALVGRLTSATGTASVALSIPPNPALSGTDIFFQYLVTDAGSPSPYGITSSPGGALQL
ncbi:MAG: hypothetical protein RL148_3084 [Planctomycetota bacterium]